ncbi:MAG: PAS domain S-box protein [Sphingobacteriales bacterium]|nr:PAS domain S-box protein [Sphingobacteriales bacterium]
MNWSKKKYKKIYYLFLFTILISLVLKEIVVQYNINQQKTDAELINLTGRQRMLSQRLSKIVLFLKLKDIQKLPVNYNIDTLKSLTLEWNSTYKDLIDNSKFYGNDKIKALYKKNSIYHHNIINGCNTYLANSTQENLTKLMDIVSENELKFLFSMEKIVFNYQKNAEEKVERLRKIEYFLFFFTLLLFIGELTIIVYPTISDILIKNDTLKQLNDDLIASESEIKKSNEFLSKLKEELEIKERLNRNFVQQAPLALAMFDENLNYLAASDKWIEDYNLVGKEIIGVNHYDLFPEIGDDWKKIHQECLAGAINSCDEAEFIRDNGDRQWISWDVRPWYKTTNEIGGLLMFTEDITLLKIKDAEKNRIEEILNKASEVARIGTWEVDLVNDKIYWSKVTKEIHEVDEDYEPILESAINFFHEGESRDKIQYVFKEAIENGIPYDVEVQLKTHKGNLIWARAIGQAKLMGGKCVGVYGVFQDINKIKTIEIALKQVNSELKAIFDASPISIIGTSLDGKITHFNKGAEKMLQYSAHEVINKLTPVTIHEKSEILNRQKELSAFYQKEISGFDVFVEAAKNNHTELRRWTYIKKDGTALPVELVVTAIKDENNHITGFLGLATDISERLINEQRILEANENLKVLTDKLTIQNKQLASFAHITSHNLRSPVGNLNALLSFYKMEESAEEKELLMDKFEIVINHLTSTLNTLVDTLKIKESTDTEIEKLSFVQIYDKTIEILVGQIMQSEAVINCDFSKAPDILYNKTYLESIFINLLTNAIKYRDDKRKPEIFVETAYVNNRVVLKVIDNGLGIDLEKHGDKLFGLNKTFHRNSDAKGVGLYLTKIQIEAMGGKIYAQSQVNKGTTFVVEF